MIQLCIYQYLYRSKVKFTRQKILNPMHTNWCCQLKADPNGEVYGTCAHVLYLAVHNKTCMGQLMSVI